MKENAFADRLSKIIGGETIRSFAQRAGISEGTVRNLLSGGQPRLDSLLRIARAADTSVEWLATGNRAEPAEAPAGIKANGYHVPEGATADPRNYFWIPMAEARLSAGGGAFVLSENIKDFYAFRKPFIRHIATHPDNLVLMRVSGNSMEPEIRDGATVMIDAGRRTPKNGCYFALGYEEAIVVKELELLPGGRVRIISRNRMEYPPYEAHLQDIRIVGQVIWGDRMFPL